MKIIYLNIRTTGNNPNTNAMIQVAGIIEIDGNEQESFDFMIDPHKSAEIHTGTLKRYFFNQEDFIHYKSEKDVCDEILEIIDKYIDKHDKTDRFYICGFCSTNYIDIFLKKFFERNSNKIRLMNKYFWNHQLDLYTLFTPIMFDKRPFMTSFNLTKLSKKLGIYVSKKEHYGLMREVKMIQGMLHHYFEKMGFSFKDDYKWMEEYNNPIEEVKTENKPEKKKRKRIKDTFK